VITRLSGSEANAATLLQISLPLVPRNTLGNEPAKLAVGL